MHDSTLCRFLSYGENREIVKEVLLDHGLKKVKLGIEAYGRTTNQPSSRAFGWGSDAFCARARAAFFWGRVPIDRIPHEPFRGVTAEDSYRYETRPYIAMSWEKVRPVARRAVEHAHTPDGRTWHFRAGWGGRRRRATATSTFNTSGASRRAGPAAPTLRENFVVCL